ncbi:MAG TPA: hypothetical protein VK325_06555 [Pseudoxanthomonas sp.]|nr:hypothetical protein [Pseudoxanthomonas sp.]
MISSNERSPDQDQPPQAGAGFTDDGRDATGAPTGERAGDASAEGQRGEPRQDESATQGGEGTESEPADESDENRDSGAQGGGLSGA